VSTLRDAIDDLFFSHFFSDAEGWLGQRFDGGSLQPLNPPAGTKPTRVRAIAA
jgi:hypothetical protein